MNWKVLTKSMNIKQSNFVGVFVFVAFFSVSILFGPFNMLAGGAIIAIVAAIGAALAVLIWKDKS